MIWRRFRPSRIEGRFQLDWDRPWTWAVIVMIMIIIIIIIIINSYSSRTRRIWADIYNQRGRRRISSYPASPRRITILVNFQAILLIFSGETSSNRDIFSTEDAAKKIFPTSKISAHQFFFIWSNLTIMAHIMGLGNQSESWKIIILS